MRLTLKREWLEPGFAPASLYESPFVEMPCVPRFHEVLLRTPRREPWSGSLESFGAALVERLRKMLARLRPPIHLALSGGYDSRILAGLLKDTPSVLFVLDGIEDPISSNILEHIGARDVYRHDMDRPDPYGISGATVRGFAGLYSQLRFFPEGTADAVLVTGLGGNPWNYYHAIDWMAQKPRRLAETDMVAFWMECQAQYQPIPDRWADGYRGALHPYSTPEFGEVAARARPEWFRMTEYSELDAVRHAMLWAVDPELVGFGYPKRVYPWRLSDEQKRQIDDRYLASGVAQFHRDDWGMPSAMEAAPHACTLAGFATWCDELEACGHQIVYTRDSQSASLCRRMTGT